MQQIWRFAPKQRLTILLNVKISEPLGLSTWKFGEL